MTMHMFGIPVRDDGLEVSGGAREPLRPSDHARLLRELVAAARGIPVTPADGSRPEYVGPGIDATLAERGEVVGVALAAIGANHFTLTRANRGTAGTGELIGAVAALQAEMIENWRGT